MSRRNKSGFILPLTLSLIGLAMALVIYMVNNGRAFSPSAKIMIEREKARMLARSGIEIAMSQLSIPDKNTQAPKATDAKETAAEKESAPEQKEKQKETLFSFIVPRINTWQTFSLKRAVEGMQGEIGVCIMCEEGKLDLNELYDPETGKLTNDALNGIMNVVFERMQKTVGGTELRKSFEKFLKERKTKLDDVTELLTIKEFAAWKDTMFYNPPEKGASKQSKASLYLTDIFTVCSGKKTVQPWLLSDSLRGIFEVSRVKDSPLEEKKKAFAELNKSVPAALNWPDGWNKYLKAWYGKEFAALPKGIETLLDTKFEPVIFSVLCYGKVGKTTQKLFAIVERIKTSAEKDKPVWNVKLKKMYWL